MRNYVVRDPKQIDGEPHEVAHEVGENLEELLQAAGLAADNFHWAARGAWMTAEHHVNGEMPEGEWFDATSVGAKVEVLRKTLTELAKQATFLKRAAAWNPRSQV